MRPHTPTAKPADTPAGGLAALAGMRSATPPGSEARFELARSIAGAEPRTMVDLYVQAQLLAELVRPEVEPTILGPLASNILAGVARLMCDNLSDKTTD